jgi:glycerophosphoryl diester phosphodiesterase
LPFFWETTLYRRPDSVANEILDQAARSPDGLVPALTMTTSTETFSIRRFLTAFLLISLIGHAYGGPVEIVAHRGASFDAPENTLAAVLLGWEQGADAVEVDVMLSRDGRIVVIHDKDTKRVSGVAGKVVDKSFAELRRMDVGTWKGEQWRGERIPTLREVLATIPEGRRMFVELKTGAEIVPALTRAVTRSGKKSKQIAIISFSFEACAEAKKALPKNKVYFLSGFKKSKPKVATLIGQAREAGLDGLDVDGRKLSEAGAGKQIKAADLEFHVYTIDEVALAKRLIKEGVDGLTTNRPQWLREQLAK